MSVASRFRRVRRALWSCLGVVSIAATLALAPAGVRIGSADAPGSLVPEALGPSSVDPSLVRAQPSERRADPPLCQAGPPGVAEARERARLRQRILRIQQEMARRAALQPDSATPSDDVIVLNGRGYSYGSHGRTGR